MGYQISQANIFAVSVTVSFEMIKKSFQKHSHQVSTKNQEVKVRNQQNAYKTKQNKMRTKSKHDKNVFSVKHVNGGGRRGREDGWKLLGCSGSFFMFPDFSFS